MPRSSKDFDSPETGTDEPVREWQVAVIDMFVHAVQVLGLPKSLGQIYGLLFTLRDPIPMDAISNQLGISVGSTSQGLRLLRQLGAVRTVFVIGNRREHFVAEKSMRRFGSGFLTEIVEPHVASGEARLDNLDTLIEGLPETERELPLECHSALSSWLGRTRKMLPLIRGLL